MTQTPRSNRFYRTALALSLVASLSPWEGTQGADPAVERVRRDLGYYREAGTPKEGGGLEAQIQGLREELRQALQRQDNRLQQMEEEIKLLRGKTAAAQPSPAPPMSHPQPNSPALPSVSPASKDKLTVCSQGCDFQDLQKAVNAAAPGGTITLSPEINGTCAVINKPLHIKGLRGADGLRAHLAGGACMGKAALVTNAPDIVIEGLEISDIQVGDIAGSCIRLDPGTRDLLIRDLYCHDSQNGLLGKIGGMLLIEDSKFEGNGFANGQAHGMYVWGDEMLIRRSQFLSAKNAGHTVKAGVQKLTIEDSVLAALNSHNSRALDAYAGGTIELRRNVFQQGPESDNSEFIGLALESRRLLPSGHSFLMEDNWLVYDSPNRGHKLVFSAKKLGPIEVRNNAMVGLTGMGIDGITDEGNRWLDTREKAGLPEYDGNLDSLPKPGKLPPSQGEGKK